jgi:hypothetical protein
VFSPSFLRIPFLLPSVVTTQFPEYLSTNAKTLPPADLERYKTQQSLVAQIIKAFEDPNYSEDDPKKAGEVLKLMNEVRYLTSPWAVF